MWRITIQWVTAQTATYDLLYDVKVTMAPYVLYSNSNCEKHMSALYYLACYTVLQYDDSE